MGYSKKHDSDFYDETKEWIDEVCGDESCPFCKDRPKTAEGIEDDTTN